MFVPADSLMNWEIADPFWDSACLGGFVRQDVLVSSLRQEMGATAFFYIIHFPHLQIVKD
jgi:hypothetical protein